MTSLNYKILLTDEIQPQQCLGMYAIYEAHYDCVNFEAFTQDLNDKNYVLLILENNHIVGFSTIRQYLTKFQNRTLQILFSGDTILKREYWGNPILALAWLRFAGRMKANYPTLPLYWFIIVKGHRTYRYLPTFSKCFYPNYRNTTPPYEQTLLDYLASTTFGNYYQSHSGLIEFPHSKGQLKNNIADIPENQLSRPDIRFFFKKNPQYRNGVELACLCELSEANLKPLAKRMFQQGYEASSCETL